MELGVISKLTKIGFLQMILLNTNEDEPSQNREISLKLSNNWNHLNGPEDVDI